MPAVTNHRTVGKKKRRWIWLNGCSRGEEGRHWEKVVEGHKALLLSPAFRGSRTNREMLVVATAGGGVSYRSRVSQTKGVALRINTNCPYSSAVYVHRAWSRTTETDLIDARASPTINKHMIICVSMCDKFCMYCTIPYMYINFPYARAHVYS